jgi:hypothetical protein
VIGGRMLGHRRYHLPQYLRTQFLGVPVAHVLSNPQVVPFQ